MLLQLSSFGPIKRDTRAMRKNVLFSQEFVVPRCEWSNEG